MSVDQSRRDAALAFIARGWHIFPLTCGTKGTAADGRSSHLLRNGHDGASADADCINSWWTRWPDANIGLNLAASGLLALDADLHKPGCGWADEIRGKDLPATFTQASPSGGRHYVFKSPEAARYPGQLCPGVDIKHRGYVLLAPSTFGNTPYRILDDRTPAICPAWVPRRDTVGVVDQRGTVPHETAAGEEEVTELLAWIDPDAQGYAGWIEILQGLHSHFNGSPSALAMAEIWSQRGAKYKAGEIPAKWADFDPAGGVTVRSIAARARANGADLANISRRHRSNAPAPRAVHLGRSQGPATPEPSEPADYSHDALAIALGCDSFDADARFVASEGRWYFWTGVHWQSDTRLEHLTRIRAFLRRTAADLSPRTDSLKEAARKTKRTELLKSNATVTAVAALARGNPASVARLSDFDRDLMVLGTPDGIVDLRSGSLRPARRQDMVSRQTICGPAASGVAPDRWLKFLDDITAGDAEICEFLQRAAGYALTGSTTEHKLLFLHGAGRNGKSVFLSTLLAIWGDYGCRVAASTLLSSKTERHPTEIASLRGARLAVASELARGKSWDEAVIKNLTGGDRMTARFMRQDLFEFEPQLTLFIAGNVQPSFHGVDEAIRSRVVLVPFSVTIPPERQDRGLAQALLDESRAILRWCIDGALAWQEHGLSVPAKLQAASQAYFDEEDIVLQFLGDETRPDPAGFVSGQNLHHRFNQWCDQQGLHRWTQRVLMKELKCRGYQEGRRSSARGLKGIALT